MTSKVKHLSDHAVTIGVDGPHRARLIAEVLRAQERWTDVVPALDSVTAFFDPLTMTPNEAREAFGQLALQDAEPSATEEQQTVVLEVSYGSESGPDLALVARNTGLSESEVVEMHSAADYEVAVMGFVPGFAYLTGLPAALATPRLSTPRPRLPAGSLGIGGSYSGIYALDGPGGWTIIGRTEDKLFDLTKKDVFALRPGMRVRFKPV
jgi:KipI family sensor histidine kinase inhibitor